MDGLFVEEVAASLVREFLSRKVRGAALHSPGQLLRFGSESRGFPCNFCTFGEGDLPLPLAALEVPDQSATFPGRGNYISQEPFLPPRTSRQLGGTRPPARASPPAGPVLLAWFREHRRQASAQAWLPGSTTTPSQDLHPVGKNRLQKEARRPKKFLTVRPLGPAHQRFSSCGPFRL